MTFNILSVFLYLSRNKNDLVWEIESLKMADLLIQVLFIQKIWCCQDLMFILLQNTCNCFVSKVMWKSCYKNHLKIILIKNMPNIFKTLNINGCHMIFYDSEIDMSKQRFWNNSLEKLQ